MYARSLVFDESGQAISVNRATWKTKYRCEKGCDVMLKSGHPHSKIAKHFAHYPGHKHGRDDLVGFGGEGVLHKIASEAVKAIYGGDLCARYPNGIHISDVGSKKVFHEIIVTNPPSDEKRRAIREMLYSGAIETVWMYDLRSDDAQYQADLLNSYPRLINELARRKQFAIRDRQVGPIEGAAYGVALEGVRPVHIKKNEVIPAPTDTRHLFACDHGPGAGYRFKTCLTCCARWVHAARGLPAVYHANLDYLARYFGRREEDVLKQIEILENEQYAA
jgi:hypothetical protein